MTTSEIIHDLNEMSVDNMGAAEGVIVSRVIWEYTALKDGNTAIYNPIRKNIAAVYNKQDLI